MGFLQLPPNWSVCLTITLQNWGSRADHWNHKSPCLSHLFVKEWNHLEIVLDSLSVSIFMIPPLQLLLHSLSFYIFPYPSPGSCQILPPLLQSPPYCSAYLLALPHHRNLSYTKPLRYVTLTTMPFLYLLVFNQFKHSLVSCWRLWESGFPTFSGLVITSLAWIIVVSCTDFHWAHGACACA